MDDAKDFCTCKDKKCPPHTDYSLETFAKCVQSAANENA